MTTLSDDDYLLLDQFVAAVISRVKNGQCSEAEAREDLMHVLGAWDSGNETEFAPWMRLTLREWKRKA